MLRCRNPECSKEIPEGMTYCNEDCLKRHLAIKREQKELDSEIEQILAYMGIYPDEVGKKVAFRHWYTFIEFAKKMNGQDWRRVRNLMRSYVNVDFRYIDDYKDCAVEWKVLSVNNGILHFHGILKDDQQ